jgi:hypothetical protein
VRQKRNSVVTWGFVPDHGPSVQSVLEFKKSDFKLVWFDGNRPAALREFQKRATVPEESFYLQMYRIEASKVIESNKPIIINPFDVHGYFKSTATLLEEMRKSIMYPHNTPYTKGLTSP